MFSDNLTESEGLVTDSLMKLIRDSAVNGPENISKTNGNNKRAGQGE